MENRSISKKMKHLYLTIYILANNLLHKIIYSKNKRFNKQLYNILFVLGLKRPILYKMDHIYDKSENIPQQWEDLSSLQLPALLGGLRIVSPAKKNCFQWPAAPLNRRFISMTNQRFVTPWGCFAATICHANKLTIYKPNSAFVRGYSAAEDLSAKSLICKNVSFTTQNKYRNIQKETALIEKFINHIMINGKRSTALNILYTALQLLVCKSEIYKNKPSPQEGLSTNYKGSGIKSPLPDTVIKTPFSSIFCFTSLVQIRDLDEMTRISKPQKGILSSVGAPCSVSKTNLPQKELLFNINQYSKKLTLNRYKNNIFVNKKPEKQINKIDQCSFLHKKVSYNINLYGMVVTNERFGRVASNKSTIYEPNHRFVGEAVIDPRFRNDLPKKKTSTISMSSYKKQMIASLLQPKKRKGFFTGKAIYKFISKKLWERSLADKSSIYQQSSPNKSVICSPNKSLIYNCFSNKSSMGLAALQAPNKSCPPSNKSKIYKPNRKFVSMTNHRFVRGDEDLLETGQQGDKNRRLVIEELLFSENNSSSIMVETDISEISQSQKMSIDLIQKAIENVKPWIEVRKVKKRGIVYLVPAFVQPHRQETLAIRWILEAARKRKKNKSTFLRGGINQHGSYNLEYDLIDSQYKGSELTNPLKTLNSSHKTNPILQREENRIAKLVNIGQNQFINDSNTKLCSFFESLAAELFDASKKQGKARQKRDEMHKVSLASRVNLRFRWWKR